MRAKRVSDAASPKSPKSAKFLRRLKYSGGGGGARGVAVAEGVTDVVAPSPPPDEQEENGGQGHAADERSEEGKEEAAEKKRKVKAEKAQPSASRVAKTKLERESKVKLRSSSDGAEVAPSPSPAARNNTNRVVMPSSQRVVAAAAAVEEEEEDAGEEHADKRRRTVTIPVHPVPGRTAAAAATEAPTTDHEPIPYSALTALDEGMLRNIKANRKRAKEAQTLLKRAVKLKEIKFFNRIIKDFGNDKQMGFADEAFARIATAGLTPTVYSYTNLLNACVRVGELGRARGVWRDMLAAGIAPNEVTYTVLLKGLAQEGLLAEAAGELERMSAEGVAPNVRTFSTLLRNCVRHANPAAADRCFEAMRAACVPPDVASFEYQIKARCAAMDAAGAWAALGEMEREYLAAPPQAYAALATVSSLTGDVGGARRACEAARAAAEENGAGTVGADDRGGPGSGPSPAAGAEKTGGDSLGSFPEAGPGGGGYGSDSDGEGGGGVYNRGSYEGGGRGEGDSRNKAHGNSDRGGHQHQHQQNGEASKSVQQFLRLRNSDALREVREVEAFLARGEDFVAGVAADVLSGPESESSPVLIVEGPRGGEGAGAGAGATGAPGAPLDFSAVFGNSLPVRMEVCSGHGDWVTARAAGDQGTGNWLALEMRRNRVRLTWAKALRRRLDNVALLCGMAHEMIGAHVPPHSLTEVHVNYPDPPEWVGSSQCLVDQPFLIAVHCALRKGGVEGGGRAAGHLTLVTDDPTYAMRMCRELSRVPHLFRTTETGGRPFRTGVPEGYGGSYFDEMWKNGNLRDRYYMRYSAL